MRRVTVITEDGRTSQCTETDQLVIGGGNARIRLPGDDSDNEYAHVENRDGHIWLVPRTPTIAIQINEKRVEQAIAFEIEDKLPLGIEQVILAHEQVPASP